MFIVSFNLLCLFYISVPPGTHDFNDHLPLETSVPTDHVLNFPFHDIRHSHAARALYVFLTLLLETAGVGFVLFYNDLMLIAVDPGMGSPCLVARVAPR